MKLFKGNCKGVTLVELILTIGIIGIVMAAIFSFLIFNVKAYYRADAQIQAQQQTYSAMNVFVEKVIAAKGIVESDPQINNDVDYYEIKKIVFKLRDNNYIRFDHKNDNKLYFGIDSDKDNITTNEYASNITEFKIKLNGFDGTNYNSCDGISVRIKSKVDESEVEVENEVYFRN